MSDINELRRLAQMATPGPWMIDYVGVGFEVAAGESVIAQSQQIQGDMRHKARKANAAFIAAANPAAISDLLDRLEAAEKSDAESIAMYRKARDERDALRAKVDAMERQEPVAWARKLAMGLPSFGCVTDLKYRPSNMPESAYMPLYAIPGAAPEPSESEARMRWLLRQIVHALPSRRDWLDPAIEREARITTTPEANHDPR